MNFLQSENWFKTKEELKNKCIKVDNYFFYLTRIPVLNKYVGYMPRVDIKNVDYTLLLELAKENQCIYVSIDPENLKSEVNTIEYLKNLKLDVEIGIPIHLQHTVIIDLSKSEEEILSSMKQKTRYNIKLAQKKGLKVSISNEDSELGIFLDLYESTVKRQNYSGRSIGYLKTVWKNFKDKAYIATVYFEDKAIASWFLISEGETLTYVYGGSSQEYKNLMAPYLLAWEIVKFGKENGYHYFDLFGIKKNLEDGYSRFKIGFTNSYTEYADTVDIIVDKSLYNVFKFIVRLRKFFLNFKSQ